MDSRVSQIEEKLNSMEDNISASITTIMEYMLKRFTQSPNPNPLNVMPPGVTPSDVT